MTIEDAAPPSKNEDTMHDEDVLTRGQTTGRAQSSRTASKCLGDQDEVEVLCVNTAGLQMPLCTCGVVTGGHRAPHAACPVHATGDGLLMAIRLLDDVVDAACSRLRDELPADETSLRYRQGMLDIRTLQNRASTIVRTVMAKAAEGR